MRAEGGRATRWIVGVVLCVVFCASSLYAVRTLSDAGRKRDSVRRLSTELSRLRSQRKQLEQRLAHVRRAARLLSRAEALGLDPAEWMLSPFLLDTERELDALILSDPLLNRLRLEKERIVNEHDITRARINRRNGKAGEKESGKGEEQRTEQFRAAEHEASNLLQRVEEHVRQRKKWLEAQTLYTGEAVLLLLNDLSDSSRGALFSPDAFELKRVSADRYEIRAQGSFLAQRVEFFADFGKAHE